MLEISTWNFCSKHSKLRFPANNMSSHSTSNGDVIHLTPNDVGKRRKGPAPAVPGQQQQAQEFAYRTPPVINRVLSDVSSKHRPMTAPPRVNRQRSAASRKHDDNNNSSSRYDASPLTTSMLQRQTSADKNNNKGGYVDPGITVGTLNTMQLLNKTKSVPELRERKDITLIRRRSIVLVGIRCDRGLRDNVNAIVSGRNTPMRLNSAMCVVSQSKYFIDDLSGEILRFS